MLHSTRFSFRYLNDKRHLYVTSWSFKSLWTIELFIHYIVIRIKAATLREIDKFKTLVHLIEGAMLVFCNKGESLKFTLIIIASKHYLNVLPSSRISLNTIRSCAMFELYNSTEFSNRNNSESLRLVNDQVHWTNCN